MSNIPSESIVLLQSNLEKKYGKGILMRLSDKPTAKIPTLSTGSILLDKALGIGGLPWGRIVEIYGLESSGKTTLALQAIAQAQKQGHTALFIDAEHAFDPHYAQALGINTQKLLMCQPDYGEQALDVADKAISSQAVKLIVIDSVSALIPHAELKGDIGDVNVGGQARLMSQAMRKLAANVHKAHAMVLFINQVRQKVGITFGLPEVTSGGNALKFYSSVRLKAIKGTTLKNNQGIAIGHQLKVKVVKNKVAPPFKEVTLELFYGEGTSLHSELIELALTHNVIQKSGSWFSYESKPLAQGKESLRHLIKSTSTLEKKIYQALRPHILADRPQQKN